MNENMFIRFHLYEISKKSIVPIRNIELKLIENYEFSLKINGLQHWKRVFPKNNNNKKKESILYNIYIFSVLKVALDRDFSESILSWLITLIRCIC